ncbi:MAG: 3-dehydroquinate synthase [Candidatus Neomarinimicrobiota bacterium]|jgi:3-dehydroquinate synthase
MINVTVQIAERPYDIKIDQHLLMDIGTYLKDVLPSGKRIAVLVSKTVKKLYLERVMASLQSKEYQAQAYLLPSGEENKNLVTVSGIYDKLIEDSFDRSCAILALGGGIVGDISGFIASSLYRGLDFIQVPTTLLSQVDSSVGGKVGVNHPAGKNLIGAFYQPKIVLIDPTVLKTLDTREIVCGYAEILKYGFIYDRSLLDLCLEKQEDILKLKDMDLISDIIKRSVEIKARIVAEDEKESGMRMLLNFGHTIGHAIENSCGYGEFLHGEAVILGMIAALEISAQSYGLDKKESEKTTKALKNIPLAGDLDKLDIDKAIYALSRDKKIRDGKLNFVLLSEIGKAGISNNISKELAEKSMISLKEK